MTPRFRLAATSSIVVAALCLSILSSAQRAAADPPNVRVERVVAQAIRPLMARYGIPGMAVGVVVDGKTYVCNFGVASKTSGQPVTSATLFEIGSVTKTFTVTLASYAQVEHALSFSDMTSTYLPALRHSSFDKVSLLDLATHTAEGLPQQVPDDVRNDAQLTTYLQRWKPIYPPGAYRLYSNISIGTLGVIAAKSMHRDFSSLMQADIFWPLGLRHTYLDIPATQTQNYAQGYTSKGAPIRMAPGVLGTEAYGVRTTAGDLLRFLEANLQMLDIDPKLQRAIAQTHTGYDRIGAMTQDLIWEQYRYPVTLTQLLQGNSEQISFEPNPAIALNPPSPPQDATFLNKTGSTNGFAAYVAFVPQEKIGVVLLANRSYPISARVTAAYDILTHLLKPAR